MHPRSCVSPIPRLAGAHEWDFDTHACTSSITSRANADTEELHPHPGRRTLATPPSGVDVRPATLLTSLRRRGGDRDGGADEAVRGGRRGRQPVVLGSRGRRDRVPRAERRRQDHDAADDPLARAADVRPRDGDGHAVREARPAGAHGRREPRGGGRAPRPQRPRPPARAGGDGRPPAHRAWTRSCRLVELDATPRAGARASTRSACASGSGSPPRCSATRRC